VVSGSGSTCSDTNLIRTPFRPVAVASGTVLYDRLAKSTDTETDTNRVVHLPKG
jgi:hypothetical protein